jgi:hypothetical protein
MDAHNFLFWFSLATGVVALCAVAMYRFTRSEPSRNSPQVAELPSDRD